MQNPQRPRRIGIIGGGPAALFLFQELVTKSNQPLDITVFERSNRLGAGMPYSEVGARPEHVTNVSDNEIPELASTIADWVSKAPAELRGQYRIDEANFNEYKVLPRLFFGRYLEEQFGKRIHEAREREKGLSVKIHTCSAIADVVDLPATAEAKVVTEGGDAHFFDTVVVCTGHNWPKTHEGKVDGWFDSPYPPQKLESVSQYPVALKGAALTAIDALRTLARKFGRFVHHENGHYEYILSPDHPDFRMVMHSNNGLLPAVRFHLDDTHLGTGETIPAEVIEKLKQEHKRFVPLDYLFGQHFKEPLRKSDPDFYEQIRDLSMEQFVEKMQSIRKNADAFALMNEEYKEAQQSIRRHESVHWKEQIGTLSYMMNYPAKHMSAEDMMRLKKVLMPLISVIIAYIPQSSCREMLALHEAGVLSMQLVDADSKVEPGENGGCVYHFTDEQGDKQTVSYPVYINCVGQPPLQLADYPFASLREQGVVSQAQIRFAEAEKATALKADGNKDVQADSAGNYWLRVPGIAINDHFQVVDKFGAASERVYNMAVPYMGGFNPDYSGLDFCATAAEKIVEGMGVRETVQEKQPA